jgi:hypothetical protein
MSVQSGGRSIPFELLREQWNEYVFSDQTVVRVRLILTHVFQEYELGPYRVLTQKLTLVTAPSQREPGKHVQGVCSDGCVKWETQPLLRDERWNEYSIPESSLVLRILFLQKQASKIIDRYDETGQPIYVIEGKSLITIEKNTAMTMENS